MEHCPNCGGGLKIIAAILEAPVIEKTLTHPPVFGPDLQLWSGKTRTADVGSGVDSRRRKPGEAAGSLTEPRAAFCPIPQIAVSARSRHTHQAASSGDGPGPLHRPARQA
jgi:hypothetical protein